MSFVLWFCISKLEFISWSLSQLKAYRNHIFLLIPKISIILGFTAHTYLSLSPVNEPNPSEIHVSLSPPFAHFATISSHLLLGIHGTSAHNYFLAMNFQ